MLEHLKTMCVTLGHGETDYVRADSVFAMRKLTLCCLDYARANSVFYNTRLCRKNRLCVVLSHYRKTNTVFCLTIDHEVANSL
jgi:hypothetical protein